jgi:predicted dienelactone hydrolase
MKPESPLPLTPSRSGPRTLRGLALGAVALSLLAGCVSVRVEAAPERADAGAIAPATARVQHVARDYDWRDEARARPVPVRLYWPTEVAPGQAVPLVVFSHGIGGSRLGYSYLGRYFAEHGIASLHLQHVGSDRAVWFGSPWELVSRLQSAAQETEAVARVGDLRYALDQVLAGEYGARIDRSRIVAAGHSYGANTALLAAGARVPRAGQVMDLRDARIRAAILMSAPPFYGEGDEERILRHVQVPTLHITATDDVIRIPGYYSPSSDRIAVFEATGSPRKALAVFRGGSHSIFTDRAGPGGNELNAQVKAATQELSLAFLDAVFQGQDAALAVWPTRHQAILARFEAAPAR